MLRRVKFWPRETSTGILIPQVSKMRTEKDCFWNIADNTMSTLHQVPWCKAGTGWATASGVKPIHLAGNVWSGKLRSERCKELVTQTAKIKTIYFDSTLKSEVKNFVWRCFKDKFLTSRSTFSSFFQIAALAALFFIQVYSKASRAIDKKMLEVSECKSQEFASLRCLKSPKSWHWCQGHRTDIH